MLGFLGFVALIVLVVFVVPADGSWQLGIVLVVGALIVLSVTRDHARKR